MIPVDAQAFLALGSLLLDVTGAGGRATATDIATPPGVATFNRGPRLFG
jgi:hypothetical protein